MTEEQIQELIVRRYAAVQSPWGLWRLNLYMRWKRFSWRLVVASATVLKRFLDVVLSALALVMFSPVFLLVAVLIKLEDGGPVFFSQTRVGQWGREFQMFKFRSMCRDADEKLRDLLGSNQHGEGVTFKIKNDPRLTRSGRWLRKFSVDELPQFYNVFRGDMSLFGPRPPVPREVALYTPADRRRLAAVPGITCFWQIGGRSEIDFSRQVQMDVAYIESQSFWVDMKILLKTVPAVLSGRGAC